ncbi:fluoride efflux transporter CrcB [Zavarzinia compransoris]|uniref:Fluoride-specific ion channel FluC n=1 Tax=Zavarzinia compransoris TaxID=1264899 RepID=A0A317E3B3_9PROT|nr:fluoride efflux transporter CrcB [Zavarzinia compransoris]PWR19883.1 fluoride efflux transporter CrcB [Zavarzinia compransoris]TDP45005.1 camphor resistance protein CrcB [Zavarzinia compransoris]
MGNTVFAGYVVVFIGSGIGGMLRHCMGRLSLQVLGPGFPYGTLLINIAGSAAMGLVVGMFARSPPPGQSLQLFLTTGIIGGFTTFSAFSLDSVNLWARGQAAAAIAYALASVIVSCGALFGMLLLTRAWSD